MARHHLHPTRAVLCSAALAVLALGCSGGGGGGGAWKPGQPLAFKVGGTFAPGSAVRDHYTGATATVAADGSVTVTPHANGVVLLEQDGAAATPFRWDNATIYFALTDRFENGDPSNDTSYGRPKGAAADPGLWHGGDWQGITARLDYLQALGVDAIWISPIVEQVRGWVSGGAGAFRHYAYAGYWALDYTKLDENFGTEADLQALVDGAHQRGIRVLVDVVLNHPGYATGDDLVRYLPEVFNDGTGAAFQAFTPQAPRGYDAWNDLVSYTGTQRSQAWANWWGPAWIRAGLGGGYATCGGSSPCTDLTQQLSFLPDFKTEATTAAPFPTLLARKAALDGTNAAEIPNATARDYLVGWHAAWVRKFGIDGFRCDTAKNVDLATWAALKDAGTAALADWKAANPAKKVDDLPFFTVGEVFPHGVLKDGYFAAGKFDSVLNFDFRSTLAGLLQQKPLVQAATEVDALYASMSSRFASDAFQVTTYLSSHDTALFLELLRGDLALQKQAGTALLLAPGSVQLYYGDESGRRLGPDGGDTAQGTRSDMNWPSIDAGLHDHWQKLATFRRGHAAIGAGAHQKLEAPAGFWAFSRVLGADKVVVLVAPTG